MLSNLKQRVFTLLSKLIINFSNSFFKKEHFINHVFPSCKILQLQHGDHLLYYLGMTLLLHVSMTLLLHVSMTLLLHVGMTLLHVSMTLLLHVGSMARLQF